MADDTRPTVDDIAKMSVADAKALLPSLTNVELDNLKQLETNGGDDEGRVTMLAAIDAEQTSRVKNAQAATETVDTPLVPEGEDPARWYGDQYHALVARMAEREAQLTAIGEAIGAPAYDDLATGLVVIDRVADLAIAKLAQLGDALAEVTTLRATVADLEQHKLLGEAPLGGPLVDHTHVTRVSTAGFVLVMIDGEADVSTIPPILTERADFRQRSADTAVYERSIAIPVFTPPFRLTAVELRDPDGDTVDRCTLSLPMEAGGGRSVELPAGTLMFCQPDRSRAEAERVSDAMAAS